ncbi:MAG: hypothetical protein R3F51_11740 [Cyanobacteriota/Melainabacteria group bacterium]
MTSDKALYSPFGFDETLAKIVQALSESTTDSSHWEPEQFEKQGLIRATLVTEEKLHRTIVLNISIIETERKVMIDESQHFYLYKNVSWIRVRVDEDIYPSYGPKEKPHPIIAETRGRILSLF